MSHWDFGQPPADQHDSHPYGSGEATYRSGSEDWAGLPGAPGAAGGPDDDASAPYPITYERGRIQPGASSPAPYELPDPWPAAPAADSWFAADQFAPDPYTPGQLAADQFAPDPYTPGQYAPDEFATGQYAPDEFATGQFAAGQYTTGQPAAGEPVADQWLRGPTPEYPGYLGTGELPRVQPDDAFEAGQSGGESWLRAPAPAPAPAALEAGEPPRTWSPGDQLQGGQWWPPSEPRQDQYRGNGPGRRWLIVAGVAVAAAAIGGATMLLTGGHSGSKAAAVSTAQAAVPAPSSRTTQTVTPKTVTPKKTPTSAPLSIAQAEGVLAGYTSANNNANAQRSDAQLATIETGSSYAIDSGLYLRQEATGAAPYPAFKPVGTVYYIPRTVPASGPRWFVVRVGNAFLTTPTKVSSTEYLLFTQATPGGPWRNAMEPYLLPGASIPQILIGADGFATPVATTATALAVAPGQLPELTATSLKGTGPVADPGNLDDRSDQRIYQGKVPAATVTDSYAPATAGQAFALRTAGGGALVFYTDAALLTITPPAGSRLSLTVPGLYSSAQSLASAGIDYRDQFAAYDPAAGGGTPRIVADYSGITGKS